jgi:hypothetical protein
MSLEGLQQVKKGSDIISADATMQAPIIKPIFIGIIYLTN